MMADRRDRRSNKAETDSSRRSRRRESTKESTRGPIDLVEEPSDMRPQYASPSTFLRPTTTGAAASYYTQSPLAQPISGPAPEGTYDSRPPHRLSISSSSSSSYIDISRKFPSKRARGIGAIRAFFTTPAEHRRRPRRRRSQRSLNLGGKNSSSSSINSDLAYGTGFVKRRKGDRRGNLDGDRRNSKKKDTSERDDNPDAKILAVGAGLAALAKRQNTMDLKEARKSGSFPVRRADSGFKGLELSRGISSSKIHEPDEEGWYSDDSNSGNSNVDSNLAYGGSTTNFFGFGRSKPPRPQPSRKSTVVDPNLFGPQNSLQGIVTRPVGFDDVDHGNLSDYPPPTVAEAIKVARRESRPTESVISGTTSLQYVHPVPTSDPTRFDAAGSSEVSSARNSRPEPVPLQHPKPYTPVSQSVYDPSYSEPAVSGNRKSQSVAGAALAGVAGAAIGAALVSDGRNDRKQDRRQEDDRDRYNNDRREVDRREKRSSRDYEPNKRSSRRDDKDEPIVIQDREKRRERDPGRDREDLDEKRRRERRRAQEQDYSKEDKRDSRRYSDRSDAKEPRKPAAITTTVDPFQYQVDKDAFPTPEASKGLQSFPEINRAPSPAVITVERVPHFARQRSDSVKEKTSPIIEEKSRESRESRDSKRTEREANDAYEEIEHFTAPIEAGAIGAAVAAEREAEHRHEREDRERRRRRDEDDDSDPRRREKRRTKADDSPVRDPVQEEANRIYREAVLARKIASRKTDNDSVVKIITPPEMEHKPGPSPYDAPNADFQLDHVMDPTGFKEGITPVVEPNEYPLPKNYVVIEDEDVKANRRPFMTLVRPTPSPSPAPERQKPQPVSKEANEPVQSKKPITDTTETQTPTNGTRSVTWGENETKHFDSEPRHEYKDESVQDTSKPAVIKDESKPKKPSRWGAVKGAFMGAGAAAGVAAATTLIDSAESKKDSKAEKEQTKVEPSGYRGVVVEPELSDDEKARGPPAVGPKPPSPQPRSPVEAPKGPVTNMPGTFGDDLDFTATVAAGLQHSGFDPNIVIDDPKYRRRSSPPGTNDDAKGLYKQPYAETVSDLGHFPDSAETAKSQQKGIVEEAERTEATRDIDDLENDFTSKLSKREQRKLEKAAKKQDTGDARDVEPLDDSPATGSLVEEPESYFEPAKTKKDKKSKKSRKSYDDDIDERDNSRVSVPIDAYDDLLKNDHEPETQIADEWDTPSSKKSKKKSKRDSESFDSPSRSMTASEIIEEPSSKKSKDKSKRKSEQYEPDIDPADIMLPASEISTRSDESRKSRKSSKRDSSIVDERSSQASSRNDDDNADSRNSKRKDKEKKNGSFFGLFGSSTGKSEVESSKDDFEEPKKKKKSKRSSTADSDTFVDARSYSNGNNKYDDDFIDSTKSLNGDNNGAVDIAEADQKDEDSFLGNADTHGAGVGLAGAAVLAAQHMQLKADHTDDKSAHIDPFQYQVFDDAFSTPNASKETDPFTAFTRAPDGTYKRSVDSEPQGWELETPGTAEEIVDPEISERHFRPSIDPQYGDLLPLPPSDPGSPGAEESLFDLPVLPESRPNSPPRTEQFTPRDRPSALKRTDHSTPLKSPSASAVPLKFMLGNRSQPSSPRVVGPGQSPMASPVVTNPESLSFPSRARPRPTSWDSTKEIQPLLLLDPSRKRDSAEFGRMPGLGINETLEGVKPVKDEDPEEGSLRQVQSTPSDNSISVDPELPVHHSSSLTSAVLAGSVVAFGAGALISSLSNDKEIAGNEVVDSFAEPSSVESGTKDRSSYLFQSTPPTKRLSESGKLSPADVELITSPIMEDSLNVMQETPTKSFTRGFQSTNLQGTESALVTQETTDQGSSVKNIGTQVEPEASQMKTSDADRDISSKVDATSVPQTVDALEEFSFSKPKKGKKPRKKQTFDDILAEEEAHPTASPMESAEGTNPMNDYSVPKTKKSKKDKKKQTLEDMIAEEEIHPAASPMLEDFGKLDPTEDFSIPKSEQDKEKSKMSIAELLEEVEAESNVQSTLLEEPNAKDIELESATPDDSTTKGVEPQLEFSIAKPSRYKDTKILAQQEDGLDPLLSGTILPPYEGTVRELDLKNEFATTKSKKDKKKSKKSVLELLDEDKSTATMASAALEEQPLQAEEVFEFSVSKSKKIQKKGRKGSTEQSEERESLSSSTILPLAEGPLQETDLADGFRTSLEESSSKNAESEFEPFAPKSKKDKKRSKKRSGNQSEEPDSLSSSTVLPPIDENVAREANSLDESTLPALKKDKKKSEETRLSEQEERPESLSSSTSLLSTEETVSAKFTDPVDDFMVPMSKKDTKKETSSFEGESESLSNSRVITSAEDVPSRDLASDNENSATLPKKYKEENPSTSQASFDDGLSVLQQESLKTIRHGDDGSEALVDETALEPDVVDELVFTKSKKDKKKDKKNRKSLSRTSTLDDFDTPKPDAPLKVTRLDGSESQEIPWSVSQDVATAARDVPVPKNTAPLDEPSDDIFLPKTKKGEEQAESSQPLIIDDEGSVEVATDANKEPHFPQATDVERLDSSKVEDSPPYEISRESKEGIPPKTEKGKHTLAGAALGGATMTGTALAMHELVPEPSRSNDETPSQIVPDGFAAGFTAEQLEDARQMREDFGSGAMKTKKELKQDSSAKKGKKGKKSRSTSRTPMQEFDSQATYFDEPQSTEPEPMPETSRGVNSPFREASPSEKLPDGLASGFTAEQLEAARQMRDDFGSGAMKSKKELKQDKKKRQSLLRTVTDENLGNPAEQDSEQTSVVSSEVNSQTDSGASTPNIREELEEFSFMPKKGKKGKKRQSSLLRTTTLDIDPSTDIVPAVSRESQTAQIESREATGDRELINESENIEPTKEEILYSLNESKSDKKAKTRQTSTIQDETLVDDIKEVSTELDSTQLDASGEAIPDREVVEQPLETTEPIIEDISYSLKKSKKDKKGKKRQTSSFDDDALMEAAPEPLNKSATSQIEPIEFVPVPEAEERPAETTEPVEEEFYSLKKSKKDKKGKKRQSTSTTPFEDEVTTKKQIEIPASTETPFSGEGTTEQSLADQIWNSVIPSENEPTPTRADTPVAESDDPLGFSTTSKKSKKDKKKKKKDSASVIPWEDDFIAEQNPALDDPGTIEADAQSMTTSHNLSAGLAIAQSDTKEEAEKAAILSQADKFAETEAPFSEDATPETDTKDFAALQSDTLKSNKHEGAEQIVETVLPQTAAHDKKIEVNPTVHHTTDSEPERTIEKEIASTIVEPSHDKHDEDFSIATAGIVGTALAGAAILAHDSKDSVINPKVDDKQDRSVPSEPHPDVFKDSAPQLSTAELLDRQAEHDENEGPQTREKPRLVSELRQMFEKEAPQEREVSGEVPQILEEHYREKAQIREAPRQSLQIREDSQSQEIPQQRELSHKHDSLQNREVSDEIMDVTEPGHKRAHEEVVDAALVAAGIHSAAGIDEVMEQNAAKGKSYQAGGAVPDQQWNDLPDDFIRKPSKKSKKSKIKSRLAAWDVPIKEGDRTTVEAPLSAIPTPEPLVVLPKTEEQESSAPIPREEREQEREIVEPPSTNMFPEPTWSFSKYTEPQLEVSLPTTPVSEREGRIIAHSQPDVYIDNDSISHREQSRSPILRTPENRSYDILRGQDNRWSSPAPLPIVIEEDSPDQHLFVKTSPKLEHRVPGHDTENVNRDSGLVTGSPTPVHRATYTDEHDNVRDSGVHLREWMDPSPSKDKGEIASTDDALARMSWPAVDEESETVDLDHSQRTKYRNLSKDSSSKGSALGAAAALAGAGIAIKGVRSALDISHDRDSDSKSRTERRTSDHHDDNDLDKRMRSERHSSVKSDESDDRARSDRRASDIVEHKEGAKNVRGERRASDKHDGIDSAKSAHTDRRSLSPNLARLQTPDHSKTIYRPGSVGSNRSTASGTPPLRRSDRKLSGDLRSLSQRSQANLKEAKDAERSPVNSTINAGPIIANEGRVRAKDMADVYDGFGEGRIGSPMSPTRPHSMRRRQSMQVLDLEARLEQLSADNRALAEAKAFAEQSLHASRGTTSVLAAREAEVDNLKQTIDWLHKEVAKLKEVNDGLTSANVALGQQHNQRYDTLASQHEQATRDLDKVRTAHGSLSAEMESVVRNEVNAATHEKDREIEQLKQELEAAKEQIREMQRQILAQKDGDSEFLTLRDEDYFDTACQQLCQHVQQWVLRFSKFSDMRACRLTSEINNDKIIDRLDNAVLDGSDVDNYLSDRVKRRDIFMSMTMTMIWEFVFTRYLFGMDREQRQKLKALEKTLLEVGPPAAVHQWRATTLTLLAKREAFLQQREQDTEAVVQLVFGTLSEILPPPSHVEDQIQDQLRRVMKAAVDLSIEMRTQRAEYMMLPPLQPEYDPNGELAQQVHFNAALMNERSGDTSSNEELETQQAVVRVVLFPLVVKKGDDSGEGDEEIVVCPAQVLVAPKKQVRVFSPDRMDMSQNHSRISMQSGMPSEAPQDI